MRSEFEERFPVRLLVVLLVTAGLLWLLDGTAVGRGLRAAAEKPISPLRQVIADGGNRLKGGIKFVRQFRIIRRRITDLERQVEELTVAASLVDQLKEENKALQDLVGVSGARGLKYIPVRVVGRGERWLVAGGIQDGVKVDGLVITQAGVVVGVVSRVGEFVSEVKLLTDAGSELAVETAGNGVSGIIVGGEGSKLKMEKILQSGEIDKGSRLVTSGADEKLPYGLVVGEVDGVVIDEAEVYKQAQVNWPVNLEALEYVFIVW